MNSTFDFKRNNYEKRQLLFKIMLLRTWQKKGTIWQDLVDNMEEALGSYYNEIIPKSGNKEHEVNMVIKEMKAILDAYGSDEFVFHFDNKYLPYFTCETGNDGDLLYYYKCADCGTIVVVDHSDPRCTEPIFCPHCCPPTKKQQTWKYYSPEDPEYPQMIDFIKKDQFYWENEWYQKFVWFKNNFYAFFWKMFHKTSDK